MKKWLVLMIAVSLGGCATGNQQLVQNQFKKMERELVDVRKNNAAMSVTVEDLETRLFLLQDELDTYRKRAQRANSEPSLPIVRLEPRDDPNTFVEAKSSRRNAIATDGASVFEFDHLENGQLVGHAAAPRTASAVVSMPAKPVANSRWKLTAKARDAIRMYRDSYSQYKNNRYENAIAGFQSFVENFPTHSYADNAIYWMGESYYDRGLWRKALQTFQQVIQNYPLENKVPDAMLKLGLCQKQLNNVRQAREILMQVAELFPKSPVARIANDRLKTL